MSVAWLLLWSQLVIAVILFQLTDPVGLFKMPKLRHSVAKQLIPLIAINVLGLGINAVCLVYVDTSFYQVNAVQHQPSSKFVIATCSNVFAGFMTGITADINVSTLGCCVRGRILGHDLTARDRDQ
ncbi:hypothetical protein BG005_005638, partial [Podila minutissima]